MGNPGVEYQFTRHNIGFLVVDDLANRYGAKWKHKFNSLYAEVTEKHVRIVLVKPLTYMNLSGSAVAQWIHYYKFPLSDILVVVDDVSLPFGTVRFRRKGGHGGHNGLKSIISALGTDEWARMRVGVGSPPPGIPLVNWVLGEFTKQEKEKLPDLLNYCADAVISWALEGFERAASRFNGAGIR
ncbi:MAG: aminoacyl-tRNA hydrolase [Chlorobi bacterium]|nr:aminoacyl-tRNA hydrolase [Chlorobiota bacterium]